MGGISNISRNRKSVKPYTSMTKSAKPYIQMTKSVTPEVSQKTTGL